MRILVNKKGVDFQNYFHHEQVPIESLFHLGLRKEIVLETMQCVKYLLFIEIIMINRFLFSNIFNCSCRIKLIGGI